MRQRSRRRCAQVAAAASLASLALMALGAAASGDQSGGGAASGLLSYTGHASAPAFELVYDNAAFPVPSHPVFTGTMPEATADLAAGPTGSAFASALWPGPLAGNLGVTVQQLNQLCPPPQLTQIPGLGPALQCLPVTDQEKQLLKGANSPVRAEATSSGTNDASYGGPGGFYMTAHVDPGATVATADGGMASLKGLPIMNLGSVTSHAESKVKDNVLTAEGTSTVTGIVIGENLPVPGLPIPANVPVLSIDSVVTTARAVSDGAKQVVPSGGSTVGGVKVLGMPATIDDKGLHVATQTTPLDPAFNPLTAVAQQALSSLKLTVTFAPKPQLTATGTQSSVTVNGMIISFTTPDGSAWQLTIGKATAMADASPNIPLAEVSLPSSGDLGTAAVPAVPSVSGTGLQSAAPFAPEATSTPAVAGQAAAATGPLPSGSAIAAALVVLAILIAGALGFGMKRMSDEVLAELPAGSACPNEGKST